MSSESYFCALFFLTPFANAQRGIMRSSSSDFKPKEWEVLRDIALRMHDLALSWPENESAADVKHLAFKLIDQYLVKGGSSQEDSDRKLGMHLLESLVFTGISYQVGHILLKVHFFYYPEHLLPPDR